jgi:predicted permease
VDSATVARLGSIVVARGPGNLSDAVQVAERAGWVAIIVLLIAFANVVNLLLARTVRRRREIAVRLALGISSARLVRLLVTESLLLSVFAALAAMMAARWGGALLRALLMPEVTWAADPLHWRVLLVGMVAAVVAGLGAGLVPALQSRAPDLTKALKAGARDGGVSRSRLRGFLVASQAALSVVLVVGAALFVRSLQNARAEDIGYAVDRVAFASVSAGSDQAARADISIRLLQMEDRIASVPGVERVAYTSRRPKAGFQTTSWFPESRKVQGQVFGFFSAVSPGFFEATGTRVLHGRTFASGSAGQSERAVLVNQAVVDSIWPNEDPVGQCLRFKKADAVCYTVVGVTQNSLAIEFQEQSELKVYLPLGNMPFESFSRGDVVLRLSPTNLTTALAGVRDLLRSEFPGRLVSTITMAAAMEPEYRPWRLGATLFTLFGGLAALVAAIGVFSSVSYAVSQRAHEFGVRVALGASGGQIVSQVVGEGLRIVAIGVAAGIALALALGQLVASLLYEVSPRNPTAMIFAAGLLLAAAAAACFMPAWRAGRSDPVSALRTD